MDGTRDAGPVTPNFTPDSVKQGTQDDAGRDLPYPFSPIVTSSNPHYFLTDLSSSYRILGNTIRQYFRRMGHANGGPQRLT